MLFLPLLCIFNFYSLLKSTECYSYIQHTHTLMHTHPLSFTNWMWNHKGGGSSASKAVLRFQHQKYMLVIVLDLCLKGRIVMILPLLITRSEVLEAILSTLISFFPSILCSSNDSRKNTDGFRDSAELQNNPMKKWQ